MEVTLTAIEGRNLAPKDSTGKSDPYLKIFCGKSKAKTNKILQTLDPQWNETFKFVVKEPANESIFIECFDWDKWSSDDFMGQYTVQLNEYSGNNPPVDAWYPLQKKTVKDEVSGDIHIRLEFRALEQPQQKITKKPPPPPPGVQTLPASPPTFNKPVTTLPMGSPMIPYGTPLELKKINRSEQQTPPLPPRDSTPQKSIPKDRHAVAIHDYQKSTESELSFQTGERLRILDESDSVWYYADLNGYQGYVPKDYVELIS